MNLNVFNRKVHYWSSIIIAAPFLVIIGTGILVDVTGRSGLFHFLSMLIVRATHGRAALLFFSICILTFAFVTVLTIVPATLIICSLVMVICKSLNYSPKPFLLAVAICANSGAIVTFAVCTAGVNLSETGLFSPPASWKSSLARNAPSSVSASSL